MVTAVLSSYQPSLMGPLGPRPAIPRTPSEETRSTSTESSGTGVEKIRLRVGCGGKFVLDGKGQSKYMGGSLHLDSVPATFKYADLAFRLTEKVNGAVSIKYIIPGEELDEGNLIDIWDDADVQEMYTEYSECVQRCSAHGPAPRLRVFLFPASEEDSWLLSPEEDLYACNFLESSEPRRLQDQGAGKFNSLGSSYSSGAAHLSPGNASMQADSRPSSQPSGMEVALGLTGIEDNPYVAPWHMPGSEETCSGLSSAMQRCLGVQEAGQALECQTQGGSGLAGGKENSVALSLPTHLSIFGEGAPKLPSHISVFGDSCNTQALVQQLQQQAAVHHPALAALGPADAMQLSIQKLGGAEGGSPFAAQQDGERKPASPMEGQGGSAFWELPKTPSWRAIYASIPHVPKDEVRIISAIAEGAFGQVSIAKTQQFGEVAIKWIKPGKVEQHLGAFWREADLLAKLNHPNVLRMYGVVHESAADPTIVGILTEYVRGGSLSSNLRSQGRYLSLLVRARLALQIASGMAFLHHSNVVHFDLKPDNLLLDVPLSPLDACTHSFPCVKVADFGLSKEKRQSYVSGVRDLRGTLPFIAPELVNDPDHVTEKADVWSMGMVMWEMTTLASPYQDMAPNAIITGLMTGSLRPKLPEWCEPSWAHLMHSCWALDPAARPSFRGMALELEHLIELLTAPL